MKMACEEQYPGELDKSETRVRNRDMSASTSVF